jgi:16S rRNA (guanine527-N7)-methyltransferase
VPSAFLERWLEEVVAAPGATAIQDLARARVVLLDDALRAAGIVSRATGPVIDVGSGGGSPGIPLATMLPERSFTLLESERRKCDFLSRVSRELANIEVVWGRAEQQQTDVFGVALAKALAKPPVAAELCLPLVRPGGIAVVWVGRSTDTGRVSNVAERLASTLEDDREGLLVLRKLGPTPPGFPRRSGMAKKRPLA